jgi:hypothetical protein
LAPARPGKFEHQSDADRNPNATAMDVAVTTVDHPAAAAMMREG